MSKVRTAGLCHNTRCDIGVQQAARPPACATNMTKPIRPLRVTPDGFLVDRSSGAKLCRLSPDGIALWDARRKEERVISLDALRTLMQRRSKCPR